MKQRIVSLICLLLAAALVLTVAGCNKDATKKITSSDTEETSEITPEPTEQPRTGGWFDDITFTVVSADEAVSKIIAGDVDIFAGALPGAASLEAIQSAGLEYSTVGNKYYEVMLNPADTTTKAKELNPFASSQIREAMNWFIDREYICQEIFGGTASPKYVPQSQGYPDYRRHIESIRQVQARYSYNNQRAVDVIQGQMTAFGAQKDSDGVWTYKNSPVVITALIRNDDSMLNQIGDYVCNELVRIGFTVERKYKSLIDCFSIWSETNPAENEWNLYTGAWSADAMARDGGGDFEFYYSPASEYGYTQLYQAYDIDDVFYQASQDLADLNFQSMEQRNALFSTALEACNQYSYRIWICDSYSYVPRSPGIQASGGIAGGVALNSLTPFTIRFADQAGGSMVWANALLFENPVNPVGGSNSEYDAQFKNFTQDYGIIPDPYTGLYYKQRIDSAQVVVQTGLPVSKTCDWVSLSFQDEIAVPAEAMIDWDAASQTWKKADQEYLNSKVADAAAQLATVEADKNSKAEEINTAQMLVDQMQAEAERGYLTARRKCVVTYPENISDIMWHDGSNMSAADFMMRMIVAFDTGTEGSAYYDPSLAGTLESFKQGFKGWRIVSADPLKIEYYSDVYWLDAEANVETMWPDYGYGQSNWADMSISLQAVAAGDAAFTKQTSENKNVQWLDWLSGPSLQALEDSLVECIDVQFVPYEPTMGQYITAEQAGKAYDNILNFYSEYGHFYIGCGPYYISSADMSAMTVTLHNYEKFSDPSLKWPVLAEAYDMKVGIGGPDAVNADADAVYTVSISLSEEGADQSSEIERVVFFVYDAQGALSWHGEGELAQEGQYKITLSPENISALGNGTCLLEVAVMPASTAAVISAEMEFSVQ